MATAVTESPEQERPVSASASDGTKRRFLYLDNLRMALITAVVVGHISVTYGVVASWYYYEEGEVSPFPYSLMMLAAGIGIGSVIGLFFLVAGYFTPGAYDRKGPAQFMIDRLKRLGIPLLIYGILINPLIHYAVDVHGGTCKGAFYDCQFQGTFVQYLREYPRNVGSLADGPVWFLAALLLFSAIYALIRTASTALSRHAAYGDAVPPPVPSNRAIALFALAIGLATFIVRFWAKAFVYYEPLHLELGRLPQYASLFIAGFYAYRGNWLVGFTDRQAAPWRWVAIVCVLALPVLMVPYGALSGTLDERVIGGVNPLSLSYSVWEGFLAVSMTIALLAWFRRRFDRQGRLAKAMSDSSFGVYVLHPAIIVPLALALSGFVMNLTLKFAIVAPIAVALSYFVVYELRRIPVVRSAFG
jgi:glucans biosynthesis protein C